MFAHCIHVICQHQQNLFTFWDKILKTVKYSSENTECIFVNPDEIFCANSGNYQLKGQKNYNFIDFFQKLNLFLQTVSLDTYNAVLKTLPETYRKQSETIPLKVQEIIEFPTFQKKSFLSQNVKCFFENVDRSFPNPIENFFAQSLETVRPKTEKKSKRTKISN